MVTYSAPISLSGGSQLKPHDLLRSCNPNFSLAGPSLAIPRISSLKINQRNRNFSVSAEYRGTSRNGGAEFLTGFLLGGTIFGTLAYVFAPQIRRSLLNEDEHGFRRAKQPIYYDEGLERTRSLNEKISQLNSAIDKVASRLRGGKTVPPTPIENDPQVEATL